MENKRGEELVSGDSGKGDRKMKGRERKWTEKGGLDK